MPNYLDIIDSLENESEAMIESLSKSTSKTSEALIELLNDFIGSLKKAPNGSIKQSVENLNIINKFRSKINEFVKGSDYGKSVSGFTNQFSDLTETMDSYYSSMGLSVGNSALASEVLDVSIINTIDGLVGDGFDSVVTQGMIDIMKDAVVSGGDRSVMKLALKDYLIKNDKLSRYANTISGDAITQFNSNYINAVAADLKLNHYFYRGTKIKTTRPFCSALIGKYFTEAELKKIVMEKSPWAGMILGTNWSNFMIYRGGYGCRHYVIPVSEAIYKKFSGK